MLLVIGKDPIFEQVNGGVNYILRLWSFGLLTIGVSTIQKFSYGMALLNILLGYLPFFMIGILKN
ncbi:MAG: hypothetical protein ACJA2S_000297 [Cyclobacteriaceae bacterium]|jgi:hypothetical protein